MMLDEHMKNKVMLQPVCVKWEGWSYVGMLVLHRNAAES